MTDYLTTERPIYTNVFGRTKYNPVTGKNKFVYDIVDKLPEDEEQPVNNEISDLLTRESGLGKTIFKTERARAAVESPLEYLKKKSEDLLKIKNEIVVEYKKLYPKNLDRYHDPELAYKRTLSEIKAIQAQKMSDHIYQFPTKIKDDTISAASTTEEKK